MTKDEIKKALRLCAVDCCEDCPYDDKGGYCCGKLKKDALNLITEQEKEIEKQKQIIENLNGLVDYVDKEIRKLRANGYRNITDAFEDNRDKIVENIRTELDDYKQSIKQAKIDVLTELKERYSIRNTFFTDCVPIDNIDQMIEELKK